MKQCLLIKTTDKREFFTHEHNLPQLIEFSRTFNAEISIVRADDVEILELSELAPMICDHTKKQKGRYEIIEPKFPVKPNRTHSIRNAAQIRKYINNEFMAGNIVSMKKLKQKYANYCLSESCLCNHLRRIKSELESDGYSVIKVGGGAYQLD